MTRGGSDGGTWGVMGTCTVGVGSGKVDNTRHDIAGCRGHKTGWKWYDQLWYLAITLQYMGIGKARLQVSKPTQSGVHGDDGSMWCSGSTVRCTTTRRLDKK